VTPLAATPRWNLRDARPNLAEPTA
jgi:hypothetical protein